MVKRLVTRRHFLSKTTSLVGAATFLAMQAACSSTKTDYSSTSMQGEKPTLTVLPDTTTTSTNSLAPQPQGIVTSTSEAIHPDLVVVRNGEPQALVEKAILALGGISRFVKSGANVIIKPNICTAYHTYEYATTTNPWVVAALVKLCLDAGASRVRVMDSPFGGTAEQAYKISGIQQEVEAAGGVMELMSDLKYIIAPIPQGTDLKKITIYDDIINADLVINVPIAKHHSLALLSLGMKNLMGTIRSRPIMHQNLGQRLAELASLVRPALTIIDAVRILVDHGPTGGSLTDVKKIDTIIASPDIVATDTYAASLFNIKPDQLPYLQAGFNLGLGQMDLSKIKMEEINLAA